MSPTARPNRAWRIWVALGPLRSAVLLLFFYGALRTIFAQLTTVRGLLDPSGAPDLLVAGLGVLVLVLRLAVVFLLPALIVYTLVVRIADVRRRRAESPDHSPVPS